MRPSPRSRSGHPLGPHFARAQRLILIKYPSEEICLPQLHANAAYRSIALAAAVLCSAPAWPQAQAQSPAHIDFQREIRPILSENCFQCHGPDAESRQANLRLDRRADALAARAGVAAIVPGNSAGSLLYQRITQPDPAYRMPLAESRKSLTPAQIALLKRWIDEGAPWKEHWAFQPPVKPKPPFVMNAAWARNAIDRFILAALEAEGPRPRARRGRAHAHPPRCPKSHRPSAQARRSGGLPGGRRARRL